DDPTYRVISGRLDQVGEDRGKATELLVEASRPDLPRVLGVGRKAAWRLARRDPRSGEVRGTDNRAVHGGSRVAPGVGTEPVRVCDHHRKEAPWSMMFADDVVLCSEEKADLEVDLERWHNRLEKRGMKVSRAKTEYMCLNGRQGGSVLMDDQQLPEVTKFKYLGSLLQSDGGVDKEISRRIQSG
ncbi:uncharacterized protein LOC119569641, partial [Penaeus monodon]|uniref:uncharacterized protein LOC119569641 n=1 Tax=Penaeus monodon TaxID=6687 RepID=UPI0018A73B9E